MTTVAGLLAEARALEFSGAARDAEILLSAALEKPRTYLMAWPEAAVTEGAANRYRAWLHRRAQGEPVAYLLGEREFWSLKLIVSPATLIPRPETELLVERALTLPLPAQARVVDLGTGSGAIALALASERPHWRMSAVDRSTAALDIARANGERLGLNVRWLQGDWCEPLADECFDLVVCNPPYVKPGDPHLVALAHEPVDALVAGDDGLADLRAVTAQAAEHLLPGGWLLLEHGFDQGMAVRKILESRGFTTVVSVRDLAGHERLTFGRWAAAAP